MSDTTIVCTCPENKPVTVVEDYLHIYNTVEEKEAGLTQKKERSDATIAINERSFNMNNLIPFFVFTAFLVICVIIGVYRDTVAETGGVPEEQDELSAGQKLKKYHSVIEIFGRYNRNVPRLIASMLVYARFTILFVCAGRFLMNNYSTGTNIASLFGVSIAFNILGRILYMGYEAC